MSFNKTFKFDPNKFQVNDSEYKKIIEKSLRKLSKILIHDSYLGYEYSFSHIEEFVRLLAHHKKDYLIHYKSNFDKLQDIKSGFYCNEKGFTTKIEIDIMALINDANDLLQIENYKENIKSKEKFEDIQTKLKEFILETKLVDRITRVNYQKKIALIKDLLESNSLISLLTIITELKELEKIKKKNEMNYQNLYLRNLNRYEYLIDNYEKAKSYFTIAENKIIDLQFNDIKDLLNSENYDKFDNASDILDIIEEKYEIAVSEKKDRIIKFLTTEVEGLKGYAWEEDLDTIRTGSEFIIAEAHKSNNFNNLNLDKFKIDEKINSKKNAIDDLIKYLIDSSSSVGREQKAKLSNCIKQSETFYRRDASKKDFEKFKRQTIASLENKEASSDANPKMKQKYKWFFVVVLLLISIFVIKNNINESRIYNTEKGQKYINYLTTLAKLSRKTGAKLDMNVIRQGIFVPEKDLQILNLTDSTVSIEYKGIPFKVNF